MSLNFSLENAIKWRSAPTSDREEYQTSLLQAHLRQAYKSPFYKRCFNTIGLDINKVSSLADLIKLPLTERKNLEKSPKDFYAVPVQSFADLAFTSGSTGNSLEVPYTVRDLERLAFNEMVNFHGVNARPGDCFLLCVTLDRCFIAGLAYYSGLIKLGASVIRSGSGQAARQWDLINRCKPKGIVGVPSFLLKMAQWGNENGYKPADSSISTLVTIGEPIRRADQKHTALGQKLEEAWGAKVFSSYGATELETAFCECTESCGGHVHPELMITEIVDHEGNVLPFGQSGEIVVTPLGVEGFPLVRFRTGDIAKLHNTPCKCGWTTQRLGPVEGRLAQRLKYKGTTLYPEMIFQALDEIQYDSCSYVEVRSSFDLSDEIVVVVGQENTEALPSKIEEHLQAKLRVKPKVVVTDKTEVTRKMSVAGGQKLKRFFDLREKQV
jgi:phenylacetate-CoA ligase